MLRDKIQKPITPTAMSMSGIGVLSIGMLGGDLEFQISDLRSQISDLRSQISALRTVSFTVFFFLGAAEGMVRGKLIQEALLRGGGALFRLERGA